MIVLLLTMKINNALFTPRAITDFAAASSIQMKLRSTESLVGKLS